MIFLLEPYRRCGDLFGDRPSACHPLVGFTTFLEDVERVDVRLKPDTGELLLTVKNHRTHSRSDVDKSAQDSNLAMLERSRKGREGIGACGNSGVRPEVRHRSIKLATQLLV